MEQTLNEKILAKIKSADQMDYDRNDELVPVFQYQEAADNIELLAAEHASQQAIAFHEWADTIAVRNGINEWTVGSGINTKRHSTISLYQLFVQYQSTLK